MTDWVPSWLARQYVLLLTRFWTRVFTVSEALEAGVANPRTVLSRLAGRGWVERLGRGEYRTVHPLAVFSDASLGWRARVRQRVYLPMLEFVLARLWEGFGERLRTVLLFGSVARGEARDESDIDLLVVADGMRPRYGDRVREVLDMLEGWEGVKRSLGERFGVHPNLDLLLLDVMEVDISHPFYFDIVQEGVLLFDKAGFMAERLERLRAWMERVGAQRVQLPGGKWYWLVPQTVEDVSTRT